MSYTALVTLPAGCQGKGLNFRFFLAPRALRKELFEKVSDLISEEEFGKRVNEEMEAWGHLLDEDVAALLVVDELGRNEVVFKEIADLYEGGEALLDVKVEAVEKSREFERRDGSQGRVVNLTVADASGRCRLTLWDDEVELVESGTVRVGSTLRVIDGYVRRGPYGLEVSSGKWGAILPR